MELKDKKIAHLRNIGETRKSAIRMLEKELERGSNFLEVAEITDVVKHRDGGIPNKRVGYVAGICGSRDAKNEFDLGEDVYSLVYFNRGNIHTPGILQLIDYVPQKVK